MWDDGNNVGPVDIHNFLTRVMYNRRNKFDPLWNSLILGGCKNGRAYLGTVRALISVAQNFVQCLFALQLKTIIVWQVELVIDLSYCIERVAIFFSIHNIAKSEPGQPFKSGMVTELFPLKVKTNSLGHLAKIFWCPCQLLPCGA